MLIYRVFRAQADWTLTHTSHKVTEQIAIEASITLDGVTLTDYRMNDLHQCLPIRCSGRLISLQNKHSKFKNCLHRCQLTSQSASKF
jgi:riboflavin synthase alpha subunit